VKKTLLPLLLSTAAVCVPARAQESFLDRLRDNNPAMSKLQPAWIAPLIQSDARLVQGARFSVARSSSPGAETFCYGNNHGLSVIAGTRLQFEAVPPAFFRNHSAQLSDGWGSAATQLKYRIASGDRDHGNFALSAILVHGFPPGANQNGPLTSYNVPKLAAGKAFGPFNLQSTLAGFLPTSKTEQQGRTIEWNLTGQIHPASRLFFDIENNAAFYFAGPNDGQRENFLTPAAFLVLKKKDWGPRHPVPVLDAGMQIATSRFHCDNHNLITELRILF